MKYRSQTDILYEMLQIAQKGALQTKIMYGTNTSHTQLKKYLKILLQEQLLTYDKKEKIYQTTEKGTEFLRKYQEMSHIFYLRRPSA
jgi:predicted transcriptional regulator